MIHTFSEGEKLDALITEIRTGRVFMDSLQEHREMDAREEAQKYRDAGRRRSHKLKHLAEIPQREYMQLIHKYGNEEVESREFIRDYQKREPDMAGPYKA